MDNPRYSSSKGKSGYPDYGNKGIFSTTPPPIKPEPGPDGSVLYNISIVNNNVIQFPDYTELFDTAPQGYNPNTDLNPRSTRSSNFNYKDPFHFSDTQSRAEKNLKKFISQTPKTIQTGSVDRHEKIRRLDLKDHFGNAPILKDKILKGEMLKKIRGGIGHKISLRKNSLYETSEFNSNQTVTEG